MAAAFFKWFSTATQASWNKNLLGEGGILIVFVEVLQRFTSYEDPW